MEASLDRPSSSFFILPSFLSPEFARRRGLARQATRRLFFYRYFFPENIFP